MALIPARYIGAQAVTLMQPARNIDGTPRQSMTLSYGDEFLAQDTEVLGATYLLDPHGNKNPLFLGVGRVVLPEHANLDERELALLGYEFHQGRGDFAAIEQNTRQEDQSNQVQNGSGDEEVNA